MVESASSRERYLRARSQQSGQERESDSDVVTGTLHASSVASVERAMQGGRPWSRGGYANRRRSSSSRC